MYKYRSSLFYDYLTHHYDRWLMLEAANTKETDKFEGCLTQRVRLFPVSCGQKRKGRGQARTKGVSNHDEECNDISGLDNRKEV